MATLIRKPLTITGLAMLGLLLLAAALVFILLLRPPAPAHAQIDNQQLLGRIIIRVGSSSDDHGFSSGYGALVSGTWPGRLMGDGNDRTVAGIYEDGDGYWYFAYSGGTASNWQSVQEEVDVVTVNVTYENEKDSRSFVLGGFIVGRVGDYILKLAPPIPSRDWDSRDGQLVVFDFRLRSGPVTPPVLPPPLAGPPGGGGGVPGLLASTPGGPVVVQLLITVGVTVFLLFLPGLTGQWKVLIVLGSLALTPWIPAVIGYGSYILSTIMTVVVAAGTVVGRGVLRPPH